MRLPSISQNCTANTGEKSTLQQVQQLRCAGKTTVEAVGFWTAVALPVPTLLLLFLGVSTTGEMLSVTGLLGANLMAFYVGHEYSEPESDQHTS